MEYLPVSRLTQFHSLIFLFGFGVYIILAILNEFLGAFAMKCYWRVMCCVNPKMLQERAKDKFSNDLYKELKVEQLQLEYLRTKKDLEE